MTRDEWLADQKLVHAKAKAIVELGNLVVLDTETTGLDGHAEVIQIAVVDRSGAVLLDSLVKPTCPVPAEATAVHGISDSDLVNAPTMNQSEQQLRATLDGRIVAVYNADFDFRLLNQSLYVRGLREIYVLPGGPRYRDGDLVVNSTCIMEMYATWYGVWHDYFRSYTWQSLGNAMRQCRLEFDGRAHSALADAKGALAVLQFMAVAETRAV